MRVALRENIVGVGVGTLAVEGRGSGRRSYVEIEAALVDSRDLPAYVT